MEYINKYATAQDVQNAVDNKELSKPYVAYVVDEDKIDWDSKDIDYSKMYLTIEALSGGTFYVRKANIGYSVNEGEWETTTGETALSLNQGDAVRFKGTAGGKGCFSGNTLAFNAYGNVESLEYDDNFIGQTEIKSNFDAFYMMFKNTGVRYSENLILPAKALKTNCYLGMFTGCISLETAPELPATQSYAGCYRELFSGCISLKRAPELPATTLTATCYFYMFNGCSNLNSIKCLATDISASNCLNSWVQGISTTGTFVKKAGVTWPTGASGIPEGWTVIEE